MQQASNPSNVLHALYVVRWPLQLLHLLLLGWATSDDPRWLASCPLLLGLLCLHQWCVVPQLLDGLPILAALHDFDRLLQHLHMANTQNKCELACKFIPKAATRALWLAQGAAAHAGICCQPLQHACHGSEPPKRQQQAHPNSTSRARAYVLEPPCSTLSSMHAMPLSFGDSASAASLQSCPPHYQHHHLLLQQAGGLVPYCLGTSTPHLLMDLVNGL